MKQIDLHRPNRATYALIASSAAVLLLAPRSIEAQSAGQAAKLPDLKALRLGQPTLLENGLARSLIYDLRDIEPLPPGVEFKASHLEKERGIELVSLYRKAAPAVLFILLEGGHGSGFLINKDGWLVTNHHVAEHGTLQEDLSREVTVMFGRFNDQ